MALNTEPTHFSRQQFHTHSWTERKTYTACPVKQHFDRRALHENEKTEPDHNRQTFSKQTDIFRIPPLNLSPVHCTVLSVLSGVNILIMFFFINTRELHNCIHIVPCLSKLLPTKRSQKWSQRAAQ